MIPFELSEVQVRQGAFTLAIPRLQAEPGTVIGLVGRNGAGKSTLLRVLAGLMPADAGEVRTLGVDPWRDPVTARRRLGYMTDDLPIWALPLGLLCETLAAFYPTWDPALAAELIRRLELDPKRQVAGLSKGEATRARLVLTLAYRPALVLLDEPATGLDVPSRRALLELVLGVVSDPARTVVIASHQVADLERVADRVLLLEQGRITADGTIAEVAGRAPNLEERLAGGAA